MKTKLWHKIVGTLLGVGFLAMTGLAIIWAIKFFIQAIW